MADHGVAARALAATAHLPKTRLAIDDLEGDLLADLPDDAAGNVALPVPVAQRHVFSHALEWLGFLANGEWSSVPVCRGRINDYLMTNRPVSSLFGDVMQIRTIDRNIFMSAVEIREYEEETEPGQLNLLMEAPFEFVLTQVFFCMSKAAGRIFLRHPVHFRQRFGDRARLLFHRSSASLDLSWHISDKD